MSTDNNHTLQHIALPYYGQRIMPRFGLARQFYLVTVDRNKHQSGIPAHCQWNPCQEPSVACWLKQMSVTGVICDGIHTRFQAALKAQGLWVLDGIWGEIDEILERWINGQLTVTKIFSNAAQKTCCRPASNRRTEPSCTKTLSRRNPT